MTSLTRLVTFLLGLSNLGCAMPQTMVLERKLERTFTVAPGSVVSVHISGGAVRSVTGASGVVRLVLRQEIPAASAEQADGALANYETNVGQAGDEVHVIERRKSDAFDMFGMRRAVKFSVELETPPDVRLDLHTSGGGITVRGERTATLLAKTSGGAVKADGGAGAMTLDTSGGRIEIGQTLASLTASTSGGDIRLGYVGPSATRVALTTSGGGIQAQIDTAAKLDVAATTSGGSVHVDDLVLDGRYERSRVNGSLNGGGFGTFRASTSGGSIRLRGASDAGAARGFITPISSPRPGGDDVRIFAR